MAGLRTRTAAAPVTEHIVDINVSQEMRTSFLEYSYSVIYSRALPDARDGLKPVQRRILFQMDQMGVTPDKGHVKSQRVVGDVMGRLHPHGDSAIYDAMVRLAQPFTMRLPLVDGHGNFGSLDDGPAAPRYTEARMAPAALAMTEGLDEDVVDMAPNYDATLDEPVVLPAAIPNLLVNGASGIAVGMATNMPPHNLGEVIAAARYLLDHPSASLDDLMAFVPGPDLPEGGTIVGLDGIREAYDTGRGTFRMRAHASIENVSPRKKGIVFTQLPYMVGPEKVIERLKDAVNRKKITGVSGVQNLTDRHHGLRLVVELKTGFNPQAVLAQLYRYTPLEESFGINNVALVAGQPQTLGLRDLLRVYVDHRLDVTRRRSQFRLKKAQHDLHLVNGLMIAVLNIDDVIAIIRNAEDASEAKQRLMQGFDLTQEQAEYILELRLRRLTKFSQIELAKRQDELNARIEELREILGSETKLKEVVSADMAAVSDTYGTPRRTILLESDGAEPTESVSLEISDDPTHVVFAASGRIARTASNAPVGTTGPRVDDDALISVVATTARAEVGILTNLGKVHKLSVSLLPQIPDSPLNAPSMRGGTMIDQLLSFHKDEHAIAVISLADDADPVAIATASGKIKRLAAGHALAREDWEVISLDPSDTVVAAAPAPDGNFIGLVSSDAQLLRFEADAVRPQGRTGRGIAGIKLSDGAHVIAMGTGSTDALDSSFVVTIAGDAHAIPGTDPGSAKVTPLSAFPAKGRATGGVRAHRFLKGENVLYFAAIASDPLRAQTPDAQPAELPAVNPKRDASGTPLAVAIAAVG
ncbi:MAG: DNA topoisomerase IV subunit A [Actinomycetaceae bacterium]|nr:DNA topoisomerase IV subunit A [Actinomycetaceae bacterium]MDY6083087.1 DNA topoisomerase IV subunit A [Actinomycetaceae bacterium]